MNTILGKSHFLRWVFILFIGMVLFITEAPAAPSVLGSAVYEAITDNQPVVQWNTVPSGYNRMLVMTVGFNAENSSGNPHVIDSVVVTGNISGNMLQAVRSMGNSAKLGIHHWYMPLGSASAPQSLTVQVNFAGGGPNNARSIMLSCLGNVTQLSAPVTVSSSGNTSPSKSGAISYPAGAIVLDGSIVVGNPIAFTPLSSQTTPLLIGNNTPSAATSTVASSYRRFSGSGSVDMQYTINPTNSKWASFAAAYTPKYRIVALAGSNGSIAPSGETDYNHGDSAVYAITPDPGYGIATLVLNGAPIPPVSSLTFNNISSSYTITVTFGLPVVVPHVVGLELGQATENITNAGLVVSNVIHEYTALTS